MADKLGRQVSGVNVEFDADSSRLIITGATATDNSFFRLRAPPTSVSRMSSQRLAPHQPISGCPRTHRAPRPCMRIRSKRRWLETTDKGTFDENDIPNWSPIFLDRGELTFDTSGTLVSPVGEAVLKSATIIGNDINVDYQGSTQFNSPFAVLNQSQNGAPEGDLVGVNIGEDGLVVASYSNGLRSHSARSFSLTLRRPRACVRSVTVALPQHHSQVRRSWASRVQQALGRFARAQLSALMWT